MEQGSTSQADPPRDEPGHEGPAEASNGDRLDEASSRGDKRREMWVLAGAGTELAVGIGLFAGLGYFVDRWLGWLPAMTVAGALLGMSAGMYSLIKKVQGGKK